MLTHPTTFETSKQKNKKYLRGHCDRDASSNSTETLIKSPQQSKVKESFRQFLARTKGKKSQEMENKEDISKDYIKDDYEKAALCHHLIRKQTGIIYDDRMTLHECPWDPNYPEKPDRYQVVLQRCRQLGLIDRCLELPYTPASADDIIKLHTKQLYEKLRQISGKTSIDDQEKDASNYDAIYFNSETFNAAVLSAGCAIALTKAVCTGVVQNGMAIIRPPGHHAMNDEYCGYCYFNNVAIAAQYALDNNLAKKILIVDFDVHHGQGTQRLFYKDNRVLYFSIHRYEHGRFWPNLRESDYDYIGEENGKGFNINFPLNVIGLQDRDYLTIVNHILLPVAYEYQPDLIIFSAGYDACIGCPEGEMNITPGFYGHLITLLSGLANGKLAVCLEGGYFLPSLAEGAAMTLKSLLGDSTASLQPLGVPHSTVIDVVNNLKIVLHDYWDCFRVYPVYTGAEGEGNLHKAIIKYEGKPEVAPFLTRQCYPPQSPHHIEKYSKIIIELQNEYQKLGTNQLVSCCYDESMLLHESNKDCHVEIPKRLSDTYLQYKQWGLDSRCINLQPKTVTPEIMKKVHKDDYVNKILEGKFKMLIENAGDMFFNENTLTAIMKAAGCLLAVVDSVMKNESRSGVALIRPPGHHADADKPSGFCYVNNIAVAAQYILDSYSVKRILIIDFDIHHGNGTQSIFYQDDRVLYLSIHRYEDAKYFPFSTDGSIDHCGEEKGKGFNVNIAMSKVRLSNVDYITIFHNIILPIAYSYAPEVILVSAGFDAGIHDKLGNYLVTPDCFGHFIQMLKPLANGKIILALEGGYNPTTVKYSMNICIKTLLGDPLPILDLVPSKINEQCFRIIDNVIVTQKKFWPALDINKRLLTNALCIEQNKTSMEEDNGNSSCERQIKPEKLSIL
ncbi:hypothetical protein ILUMI_27189 [Ignelater luminosus]|uniref:Histone deacetylase domain-containing protein n=1 Tax=Ignelater luminosus TaxID=2038154 RepID=A0A8K0C3Q6_IGNLU|nr:hypothetical protein ILUMI_27189 [Ignelater luminosus]